MSLPLQEAKIIVGKGSFSLLFLWYGNDARFMHMAEFCMDPAVRNVHNTNHSGNENGVGTHLFCIKNGSQINCSATVHGFSAEQGNDVQ
jgi:hypothetical protein